jgi:D-aminoacyl-tRNA deacylase
MRVVIQRVKEASVTVEREITGAIGHGLLLLLGIEEADDLSDVEWLCKKISALRIFNDEEGKMNLDIASVSGSFLVVSQFTLHASYKKGNRPSFIRAAHPDQAIPLYNSFVTSLQQISGRPVGTGVFGAMMNVTLTNDGPVTIVMDSRMKE